MTPSLSSLGWRVPAALLGAAIVLESCSTPWSSSNPKYGGVQFQRVVVVVPGSSVFRQRFEALVVDNLSNAHLPAVQSSMVLRPGPPPPSDEEKATSFRAAGADAVLVLGVTSTGQGTWGNPWARLMTLPGEVVWTFNATSGGANDRALDAYFRAFCDEVTSAIVKKQLIRLASPET